MRVLVRGLGDIGSAVAHRLFREGYAVVAHDGPKPTTTRRGMAFANAAFDGRATLDGVDAVRAPTLSRVTELLASRSAIPVYVRPLGPLLTRFAPDVLVDARMCKHADPEVQTGLAPLVVGLGPGLVAGRHADVVVETSWEDLGRVIATGPARPLVGEPRMLGGHARDRYVYAPVDGVFQTKAHIGDVVRQGQDIAEIGFTVLAAPVDGVIRGLTRDGVPVRVRTKVIEMDPRGAAAEVHGIAERPRRTADGVLAAIQHWEHARRV
jgi:xanthine dehydrogenase accessory factor